MSDYSFGPSAKGWMVLFVLAVIGLASIILGFSLLINYLLHHLRWV